jgi:putative redox protein
MAGKVHKITASLEGDGILCSDQEGSQVMLGDGGPSAIELLLMSVAGCSGATLNALFNRDKVKVSKLEMAVEGVRSDSRPTRYTDIKVEFIIDCDTLTHEKLEHYLQLAERLCPVVQSLNSSVHYTYRLNE